MLRFKVEPVSVGRLISIFVLMVLWLPVGVFADIMLNFQWDPSPEPHVAGYRIFSRIEGVDYDYDNPDWEGQDTECPIFIADAGTPHYFVVRAYGEDDFESADSNEVRYPPAENELYRGAGSVDGGGEVGGCFLDSASA